MAAPLGYFRGFGPRFRVHLLRHSCCLLWLLPSSQFPVRCRHSRRHEAFFELAFHFDYTRQLKKRISVPMQTGVKIFSPGENKLHRCKARVYETICSQSLFTSFISGPSVACLVRMRDDALLLHSWDNSIYSVHELVFETPWLWIVNRGNSHIFIGYILITSVDFIGYSSVCVVKLYEIIHKLYCGRR